MEAVGLVASIIALLGVAKKLAQVVGGVHSYSFAFEHPVLTIVLYPDRRIDYRDEADCS